ncbi:MAG: FAD-dependent oxidoreductase, partial [Casimicrobiaceae bacterium]
MPHEAIGTSCCIAGGGPAGMMLGFLLARAGVDVIVLEKHADFFRDFRGDTIHPSTLEVMHELGILEAFLALPHQQVTQLHGEIYGLPVTLADFTRLSTYCKFLVFMPQWDFLDFLARQAGAFPHFSLRRRAPVAGLIEEEGVIRGVRVNTPQGELEIRADLVVGADGRHSVVREAAELTAEAQGAPIDVLWFHLPRAGTDPEATGGYIAPGALLVTINRRDYWQCGFVIPKGDFAAIEAAGLPAFRRRISALAPFLAKSTATIGAWDDVKLLSVQI